jgi:hypothetical protein
MLRASIALCGAILLHAQDSTPAFEVASVKSAAMPTAETKRGVITAALDRIAYTFVALGVLLEKAYGCRPVPPRRRFRSCYARF